jgi:hypothetical protein
MKNRDEIEKEILKQMKEIKERVKKDSTTVPYDKETARSAIQEFLSLHPEKEKFLAKLKSKMEDTPN